VLKPFKEGRSACAGEMKEVACVASGMRQRVGSVVWCILEGLTLHVRCTVALVREVTCGLCVLFVFMIIGILVELMLACWVQS
jgi:hypothetical protein